MQGEPDKKKKCKFAVEKQITTMAMQSIFTDKNKQPSSCKKIIMQEDVCLIKLYICRKNKSGICQDYTTSIQM